MPISLTPSPEGTPPRHMDVLGPLLQAEDAPDPTLPPRPPLLSPRPPAPPGPSPQEHLFSGLCGLLTLFPPLPTVCVMYTQGMENKQWREVGPAPCPPGHQPGPGGSLLVPDGSHLTLETAPPMFITAASQPEGRGVRCAEGGLVPAAAGRVQGKTGKFLSWGAPV